MISGSASLTKRPVHCGTRWSKAASASTGLRTGRPSTRDTAASSSPKAGAMWTMPEPSSTATYSAATTRHGSDPAGWSSMSKGRS